MNTLKDKEREYLNIIINGDYRQSNKIFDKHDNCFQGSLRRIETVTGVGKSTIGRLFGKLKKIDLARNVIDVQGESRLMLNPDYEFCRCRYEKNFAKAMYVLGSDKKAREWSNRCLKDRVLYKADTFAEIVDLDTGEVTYGEPEELKVTNRHFEDWEKYKNSYSRFDRSKSRRKLDSNKVFFID